AWQLQPQILERRQATSGQLFADLRPDALQDADRSLADRRQRGCGSVGAGHQSMARMASTSNVAAFGRDDTPIVERAGYGASKHWAVTAVTAASWPRSLRYRPSGWTCASDPPAAAQTAARLSNARRTWASKSPPTSAPVAGSSGICPDRYTVRPLRTACE